MKKMKITYWAITGFLAFGMLAQGFAQVAHAKGYVDMINSHLGYPSYFLYIIGIWKLLGVAAILVPGFLLLKEWAYAGFFFVMSGAVISHLAAHDSVTEMLPASFLLVVIVLSWYFRPPERRLVRVSRNPSSSWSPT